VRIGLRNDRPRYNGAQKRRNNNRDPHAPSLRPSTVRARISRRAGAPPAFLGSCFATPGPRPSSPRGGTRDERQRGSRGSVSLRAYDGTILHQIRTNSDRTGLAGSRTLLNRKECREFPLFCPPTRGGPLISPVSCHSRGICCVHVFETNNQRA
jgi:hypothetical protein